MNRSQEFVALLPKSGIEEAALIAERIKDNIDSEFSQGKWKKTMGMKVTASIGISTFPNNGNNIEDFIHSADTALYSAKERGKNVVVCA